MFHHTFLFRIRFISDNRAGPSNLGNVISQILLCKQITPDFNAEELCSITKDSQDIAKLLSDMQEYIPNQETYLGKIYRNHFAINCAHTFAPFSYPILITLISHK